MDMQTIDICALIAYPITLISLLYLIWSFSASFFLQIRNRLINIFMAVLFIAVLAYSAQMYTGFKNRLFYVINGIQNPSTISTQWAVEQCILAVALLTLAIMVRFKLTRKFYSFARKTEEDKNDTYTS